MIDNSDDILARRFHPLANGRDDRDWPSALREARRSPRRRIAVAALGAAAFIGVAAPALGLHRPIVTFLEATHAPDFIQRHFAGIEDALAPDRRPRIETGEARIVMSAHFDGAEHTLSVTPTKTGRFCWQWSDHVGSCRPDNPRALNVTLSGDAYGSPGPSLVTGYTTTRAATTIEVTFADGHTAQTPITWVTAPINAGFFAYPVPPSRRHPGRDVTTIIARDPEGALIARFDPRGQ